MPWNKKWWWMMFDPGVIPPGLDKTGYIYIYIYPDIGWVLGSLLGRIPALEWQPCFNLKQQPEWLLGTLGKL
jgi:hypothetical protein